MSTDTDELTDAQVRMKKDGTLIQKIDGKEVTVATYHRTSGHLEFETKENSQKLYNQVTAKIGTVNKGTQPSGNVIKSISVKGEERVDGAKLPKKPKMGPEGDATPALVDWYIKNDLAQAIIRYGIYTGDGGLPIRKKVKRVIETTVDHRDMDDDEIPWVKDGKKTQTKAPVGREYDVVELKSAIIARRWTRYEEGFEALFKSEEVVGGFQPNDDFESPAVQEEDEA